MTSPNGCAWRSTGPGRRTRCRSPAGWRAWANWPAGSRTTSTICSAVILGSTAFLEDELTALNEQDTGRPLTGPLLDVQQIKNAAERAARQTQQLLAFGRRETVQPRPVDLNDIVTAIHGLLSTTLGAKIHLVAVGATVCIRSWPTPANSNRY